MTSVHCPMTPLSAGAIEKKEFRAEFLKCRYTRCSNSLLRSRPTLEQVVPPPSFPVEKRPRIVSSASFKLPPLAFVLSQSPPDLNGLSGYSWRRMDWFLTPEILLLSVSLLSPLDLLESPAAHPHRLQALFGLFKAPSHWERKKGHQPAGHSGFLGPTGEIN